MNSEEALEGICKISGFSNVLVKIWVIPWCSWVYYWCFGTVY